MQRALITLAVMLSALALACGCSQQPPVTRPEFKLGFKSLADRIPDLVGSPEEDEQIAPNDEIHQRTTRGLLVWRKADNWTGFTDGASTWVIGPDGGVHERPNSELFPWELAPTVPPTPAMIPAAASSPAVATATPSPVVAAVAAPRARPPGTVDVAYEGPPLSVIAAVVAILFGVYSLYRVRGPAGLWVSLIIVGLAALIYVLERVLNR